MPGLWTRNAENGERIYPPGIKSDDIKQSYSEDYGDCADRAKNELDNRIRPALSSHIDVDIMAQYDVIYLGFPVW